MNITNHQYFPAIALEVDGDFVVTWSSYGQDGSDFGVYAQRYNVAGVPQGVEFRVNSYTTNSQIGSAITMDTDGDYAVAWASLGQDGSQYGIYAQRYNAAGMPQGGEFRVNSFTTNHQSGAAIAMDADGNFVVAWSSDGQDGSGFGVYAKRNVVLPAPAVNASNFNFATLPQRLSFTFNQNVGPSLELDDIVVQQLPAGPTVTPSAVSFDAATNTATFTFNSPIPDGRYRARLIASGISGPGGQLPADHTFEFTFLRGDANGDGTVNLADFNVLAANFGQSPRDFTQGDFDYSGVVNLADFNLLASRFGAVVGPTGTVTHSGERLPGARGGAGPFGTGLIGGGASDETEEEDQLFA